MWAAGSHHSPMHSLVNNKGQFRLSLMLSDAVCGGEDALMEHATPAPGGLISMCVR